MINKKYVKTKYTGIRKNIKSNTYRSEKSISGKRYSKSFAQLKDAITWYRTFNGNEINQVEKEVSQKNIFNGSNKNSLEQEWEEYLNHKESFCATSTVQATRARGKYFFNSKILNTPIREITYKFLCEYIKEKKADADKNRLNFNEDLKKLKAFFNFYYEGKAKEIDPQFKNPVSKHHFQLGTIVPKSKIKKARKVLSIEELKLFLSKLEQPYKDFCIVQFFTAGRVGEIAGIHTESVKLKSRSLEIRHTVVWKHSTKAFQEIKSLPKNGEIRNAYINDVMLEIIQSRMNPEQSLLFCDKHGMPLSYRKIQYHYNKALRKAGLNVSGTHFIRHTAATIARQTGSSIDSVMSITGHKSCSMAEHYGKVASQKTIETSMLMEDLYSKN